MNTLKPIPRTLLRDSAYRAIRDAIVREEIAPGSPISDVGLADQLGLSRAPVRESFARLAYEGLVETKPQSYTRVTPLLTSGVREAAVVVRAMHELAARSAASRLNDNDLNEMRECNTRFAAANKDGDLDGAMAADDELHGVLVRTCDNYAVSETIERYTPLIRRLERRLFSSDSALRSVAMHDRLIDACSRRDSDDATLVTGEIWRSLEQLADALPAN